MKNYQQFCRPSSRRNFLGTKRRDLSVELSHYGMEQSCLAPNVSDLGGEESNSTQQGSNSTPSASNFGDEEINSATARTSSGELGTLCCQLPATFTVQIDPFFVVNFVKCPFDIKSSRMLSASFFDLEVSIENSFAVKEW